MPTWSLYVLRCGDESLYTGITTNIERRLAEHEGGAAGAKSLRGRGPLELVFCAEIGDRSRASRAEYRVKRLHRAEKLKLVQDPKAFRRRLARMTADS